ncbi:MAG TPA: hypothetical protein VF532_13775 [Candidatus Angelobacter sp.]
MVLKVDQQIQQNAVKVIHHPDGRRRVVIFQRSDGTFDFEEEQFWDDENSWAPLKKETATVVDTLDRALEEVKGRIDWVQDL